MPSDDYAARLERVMQKRVGGTMALQGAQGGTMSLGRMSAHSSTRRGGLPATLGLPIALAVGMGAVVLGNWARFHLQVLPAKTLGDDMNMLATIGIGLALALLLRIIFRLNGKLNTVFILAGVVAMTLGFHNLHHWFPEASAMAFSPEYAAQMQGATPANSIQYRGEFIPFALEQRLASVSCAVGGQMQPCE